MSRYQIRLRYASDLPARFASTQITQEVLAGMLPAGTKYSVTPLVDGYELAVDLDKSDHAQVMTDLASAFRQLGFSVLQATIIDFASSWLEGGAIGTLGGGLVGAATRSVEGFVLLALAGFVFGALRQTEKARYFATPTTAGWQVTRLESEPPARAGNEPAF